MKTQYQPSTRAPSVRLVTVALATTAVGIVLTAGIVVFRSASQAYDASAEVRRQVEEMSQYEDARAAGLIEGGALAAYFASGDPRFLNDIGLARSRVDVALGSLAGDSAWHPAELRQVQDLIGVQKEITIGLDAVIDAVSDGDLERAVLAATTYDVERLARTFDEALDDAANRAHDSIEAAQAADQRAQVRWFRTEVALLAGLAAVIAVGVAFLFFWVARPLERLARVAQDLTSGQLSARASLGGLRDIRQLAGAVNAMADSLLARSAQVEAALTKDLKTRANELERVNEKLLEQARRDSLTQVLNHGALIQELRSVIDAPSDSSVTAIVMADVDGLKAINDVHGHTVGDDVLVSVAQALSQDGVVVGRYGGDEFVAIIRDCLPESAEQYQKTVLDRFESASVTDPDTGARVSVSVSLGIALYPAEADAVEGLIQASDSAMYTMKRTRRFDTSVIEQPLGTNRAAELVGQLAPLLAAPGNVDEKLQLVSKRLSGIAGYDAVNVTMFAPLLTKAPGPRAANTFANVPQHLVEAWDADQRADASEEPNPVRLLLERTRRPLIFDDPWNDEHFTEQQRSLLRAADLKSVLVAPLIWKNDVAGFLGVASKPAGAFAPSDGEFLASVAMHVSAIVQMATLVTELEASTGELKLAHEETVLLLAASAEAHDQTTGHHLHNVRRFAELLAETLGHSAEDVREIALAAVMHDIGKVSVPDGILRKPVELSADEWEVMRLHTVWGAEFLSGRRGFEFAAAVARSHHERWDGSGYPDRLAGPDIPEGALIATVADAFDAMLSARPYKRAYTVEQAIRELSACSGKQFSPRVVEAFLQLYASGQIDMVLVDHAEAA